MYVLSSIIENSQDSSQAPGAFPKKSYFVTGTNIQSNSMGGL